MLGARCQGGGWRRAAGCACAQAPPTFRPHPPPPLRSSSPTVPCMHAQHQPCSLGLCWRLMHATGCSPARGRRRAARCRRLPLQPPSPPLTTPRTPSHPTPAPAMHARPRAAPRVEAAVQGGHEGLRAQGEHLCLRGGNRAQDGHARGGCDGHVAGVVLGAAGASMVPTARGAGVRWRR